MTEIRSPVGAIGPLLTKKQALYLTGYYLINV